MDKDNDGRRFKFLDGTKKSKCKNLFLLDTFPSLLFLFISEKDQKTKKYFPKTNIKSYMMCIWREYKFTKLTFKN